MKLQIIVGSTRPGRVTERVAKWAAGEAKKLPNTEVEIVDLADYPLPLFNEAVSPQYNPNRQPEEVVKRWLKKIGEADAYLLVTPEHNRSTSAVLKNAIDYLDVQFARKPVALLAHGSTGGAQAVAQLRGILPGVLAVSVPRAAFVINASAIIDENGRLDEAVAAQPYGPLGALQAVLADLKWYGDALKAAREASVSNS